MSDACFSRNFTLAKLGCYKVKWIKKNRRNLYFSWKVFWSKATLWVVCFSCQCWRGLSVSYLKQQSRIVLVDVGEVCPVLCNVESATLCLLNTVELHNVNRFSTYYDVNHTKVYSSVMPASEEFHKYFVTFIVSWSDYILVKNQPIPPSPHTHTHLVPILSFLMLLM